MSEFFEYGMHAPTFDLVKFAIYPVIRSQSVIMDLVKFVCAEVPGHPLGRAVPRGGSQALRFSACSSFKALAPKRFSGFMRPQAVEVIETLLDHDADLEAGLQSGFLVRQRG